MFERFSEDARQVVVFAQEEARTLGYNRIETGHLLLGVVRVGGAAAELIEGQFGARLDQLRALVRDGSPGFEPAASGQIPFVPDAKGALEASLRVALAFGHTVIQPLHLLRGLLESREMASVGLLGLARVNADLLRVAVDEQLRVMPPGTERTPEPRPRPRVLRPASDPLAGIAPAVLSLELTLGRSESVAVLLPELRVYPGGTLWPVMFLARSADGMVDLLRSLAPAPPPDHPDRQFPPCDLSVRYPDGRHARLVGIRGTPPYDAELGVWSRGSAGGGESFGMSYYVAPLPTSGTILVSCEWPAYDIAKTESEIDAAMIITAAARAKQLWTDPSGAS